MSSNLLGSGILLRRLHTGDRRPMSCGRPIIRNIPFDEYFERQYTIFQHFRLRHEVYNKLRLKKVYIRPGSSRQEPPEAAGKCLFSLFPACFRGGATRSFPYLSCSPAPHRTGQAAFPHPAPQFAIRCASALRHGSRSLRILAFGHFTQISA